MTNQLQNLLLEAASPSTPPSQLGRFASSREVALRHAVAGNPNTPSETLWRLAVRDASAVLENSVLGFLILENPNFLAELPAFARTSFLRCKDVPPAWLDWVLAWGDQDSKVQVLQNPSLKPEILEALEKRLKLENDDLDSSQPGNTEPALLAFLAKTHVNHPQKLEFKSATQSLQDMLPFLEHDGDHLKDAVALGLVPIWLLEGLSLDDDPHLRLMLAKSTHDQKLNFHLCFDDDDEVRVAARSNPNLASTILETLARVENFEVLSAEEILLLETGGIQALTFLARNPSVAALEKLVSHSDWRVRQAVAQNVSASVSMLEKLQKDDDKDVRIAVAQHVNASKATLEFLTGDEVDEVRLAVQSNSNTNPIWHQQLEQVEHQENTVSLEFLQALCERGGWSRQLALKHPNISLEILEPYLTSENWHDRVAAASNPNLSTGQLETLALDTDSDVQKTLAAHPNLSPESLEKFIKDENHEVRKSAASNINIALVWLEKLASDEHWAVRQSVAQNARVSFEILKTLLEDSDNDVRQAARVSLRIQDPQDAPPSHSENLLEFYQGWFEDHPNTHAKLEVAKIISEFENTKNSSKTVLIDGEQHELNLVLYQAEFIPKIPLEIFSQLARNEDWRIRQGAARYPFALGIPLARLCLDGDADVREAAASNIAITNSMICKLAKDENTNVRATLVKRENLPLEALQLLCCDEEIETRATALKHPNLPRYLAEKFERLHALDPKINAAQLEELTTIPSAHAWIAKHPNVTTKLLEQIAWREHWRLREAAASNPKLEHQVLAELAQDTDLDVLRALARNSSTSSEVLLQLVNHSDSSVRLTTLENPNFEQNALTDLRRACIRQGLRSNSVFNRVLALCNELVPKLELTKKRHLHAAHPAERIVLCLNPNLPKEARETLQQDANILVRSSALEN